MLPVPMKVPKKLKLFQCVDKVIIQGGGDKDNLPPLIEIKMKWNDTTLSTLETISRWEKEVNELAGYDSIPAIQGNKTAKIIDINKSIDSIVYTDPLKILHTSEIETPGEWDIPESEIITILYYIVETFFCVSNLIE